MNRLTDMSFMYPWHFSDLALTGQQKVSGYTKIIASFSLWILSASLSVTKCFEEQQKERREGRMGRWKDGRKGGREERRKR